VVWGKAGRIGGLGVSQQRRSRPVGDHIRTNVPDNRSFGFAGRNQAAENEPPVLCPIASVIEREWSRFGTDTDCVQRIFRSKGDAVSGYDRKRLRVTLGPIPLLLIRQLLRIVW